MAQYTIEYRNFKAAPRYLDMARHIQARCAVGRIAIIADRPVGTLSALRWQWKKLARYFERERAANLSPIKRAALTVVLQRLYHLQFTTATEDFKIADILIMTPGDCHLMPNDCKTVYICSQTIGLALLEKMLARLSKNTVVVDYVGWDLLKLTP